MDAVQRIFHPLDNGNHIVIHRGRDLRDFTCDEKGRILPLFEAIRREAMKRGMVLIEYSKSGGVLYDAASLNKSEAQDVDNVLSQYGIANKYNNKAACANDEDEFVTVMRGLLQLVQASSYPKFRDGKPMAFMVVIEFAEHQCPSLQPGFLSQEQMISIELASKLSKSLGLRKSGCYLLFSEAREGTLDDILTKHINVLRLPQPDAAEKERFLSALKDRYPVARQEEGLDEEAIINISSNSPNRGLEQIYLSSSRTGEPITAKRLSEKKQEDIINLSEGTLESVGFERIKGQKLAGRNIERPLQIISKATNALKIGEKSAFRNLILAGAPSTGKTHLATYAAYNSGIQAFTLNSPKSGIVGESERKTRLMLSLLKEQKGVGIIDELEMILPMNRSTSNHDSGVTQNLMGQLQSFLSDSSLAGKVSLIATSNKPGDISAAMLSRWIVVPVLMPLQSDYPFIVESIVRSIDNAIHLESSELKEISDRFYYAGATPREIREGIVGSLAFINGYLSIQHLDYASKDIVPSANRASYLHSDLTAIKFCRSNSFFPWWDLENNKPASDYPYPQYILDVMDKDSFIDPKKLDDKIAELAPYSNV